MKTHAIIALLAGAAALGACGPGAPERNAANMAATPDAAASANRPMAADAPTLPPSDDAVTPTNAANAVAPDLSPPALTEEAERGETGARNLLLSFARAIETKQFEQARALLSVADKQKWSRAQFAALFADLDRISVAVPAGEMEGAAGSLYYTAPVIVTAAGEGGRPVRLEGEAILRRVNGVEGATPAQLRWHFERLTLDWTH